MYKRQDEAYALGKIFNYTSDSLTIQSTYSYGNDSVAVNKQIVNYAEEWLKLPSHFSDTTTFTYQSAVQGFDYADGEERKTKIIPKGTTLSVGEFSYLEKDTSYTVHLKDTVELTMQVNSSIIHVLIDELEALKNYPYGCNEQIASKLKGLLLLKQIKQKLNTRFKDEATITKLLKILQKNQHPNGSWGWWGRGEPSIWVTAYVANVLKLVAANGYDCPNTTPTISFLKERIYHVSSP